MKILFCNISWMKYYKGVTDQDIPVNGGAYVKEYKNGGEVFNFHPIEADGRCYYCYGYVETMYNRKSDESYGEKQQNELHFESIENCEGMKDELFVDDVLVIFCAKPDRGAGRKDFTYCWMV